MLDPEWRVTYWNAAAEQLLGVARDVVLSRVLFEEFPDLEHPALGGMLHLIREDGVSRRCLQPCPPGRTGLFSMHGAPAEDAGVAIHFRDAADESELAARYTGLLESIRDGFIAVDADWRIIHINGVAESLLRLSPRRAVGALLWSHLPEEPAVMSASLQATMQDGAARQLKRIRPQGRVFGGRVFDLWIYPLPGGGVSMLFEDVSERLQREKDLARFAAEAQNANRAKSRFFAAVSHELRTPLNAIVGYTHLLSAGTYGEIPPAAQRAATRASVCAEHLVRLIDDVLLLTSTEVGRLPVAPVPVLLDQFLPGVVEPLRLQAEAKGLQFSVHVGESVVPIITDPDRLRQLLFAVLSNAIKFTHRGAVRVEAQLVDAAEAPPAAAGSSRSADTGRWINIAIRDTGPGIAPEDWDRIFDPFEQLGDPSRSDSMRQGTGLGLTIAGQLANLLRGKLWVEAEEAGGSVFHVRLPVEFGAHNTPVPST